MPESMDIIYVKYKWGEPSKNIRGIPTKVFTSYAEAEQALQEASREHDIFDVEIYAAQVGEDAWEEYEWIVPRSGNLVPKKGYASDDY